MCEELDEELARGSLLAFQLAEHLDAMGAANLSIPIETEEGCYIVEIRKTL